MFCFSLAQKQWKEERGGNRRATEGEDKEKEGEKEEAGAYRLTESL